ncbi:MAG: nucleotidyl transferase AbiEii/AbiGii toxin family protein [Candidatus Aminicenantales bacterium]
MKKTGLSDIPSSIRQRLLNASRDRKEEFQRTLNRYAIERFLYRLGQNRLAKNLVLKGAFLFEIWNPADCRPTRDADFLSFGEPKARHLGAIFASVCRQTFKTDGMTFDADTIRTEPIREGQFYGGLRVRVVGHLGTARTPLQFDIGFGDKIIPRPTIQSFPSVLGLPKPRIKIYSKESVIAEKYQTVVFFGMINSRLKDYFDLFEMSQNFGFEGSTLSKAVEATFKARRTQLPAALPLGLSKEFYNSAENQRRWRAFLERIGRASSAPSLERVVKALRRFLTPLAAALIDQKPFNLKWPAGGLWQ